MEDAELIRLLDRIRGVMISVATGGPRIGEVEHEFTELYNEATYELNSRGIFNALPFRSLWEWHGRWSGGDMPTYASRRTFVNDTVNSAIDCIQQSKIKVALAEPTGWERVDRAIGRARESMSAAKNEEDFQTAGLLSRELLISLGQAVYDRTIHGDTDANGITIGPADFKRMIEAYIEREHGGGAKKELRKYARAALDAANDLQHNRTATFRDAAICVEIAISTVNVIAIMAGVRDPKPSFSPTFRQ